jgi:hypothetical protein
MALAVSRSEPVPPFFVRLFRKIIDAAVDNHLAQVECGTGAGRFAFLKLINDVQYSQSLAWPHVILQSLRAALSRSRFLRSRVFMRWV